MRKYKYVSLRATKEDQDILKRIADGKTISYVIRQLIRKEADTLNKTGL